MTQAQIELARELSALNRRLTALERAPRLHARALQGFDFGQTVATTNGSGQIVVPHDLGVTPEVVLASTATSAAYDVRPGLYTATTFTATVYNGTTPVTGTSVRIRWVAFAA